MEKIPLTEGSTKSNIKDLDRPGLKIGPPIGPPPPSVFQKKPIEYKEVFKMKKYSFDTIIDDTLIKDYWYKISDVEKVLDEAQEREKGILEICEALMNNLENIEAAGGHIHAKLPKSPWVEKARGDSVKHTSKPEIVAISKWITRDDTGKNPNSKFCWIEIEGDEAQTPIAKVYKREHAQRIVAYHNACAGINPEAVPLVMKLFAKIVDEAVCNCNRYPHDQDICDQRCVICDGTIEEALAKAKETA